MAVNTRKSVTENGTIVLDVSFLDEDGIAVIPATIAWTLTDDVGTIINSRHAVSVAVPAAAIHIVITGDDAAILSDTDQGKRVVLLEWTYNSTLGAGLAATDEILFSVRDTVHGS